MATAVSVLWYTVADANLKLGYGCMLWVRYLLTRSGIAKDET